jgi:hypothetical protein
MPGKDACVTGEHIVAPALSLVEVPVQQPEAPQHAAEPHRRFALVASEALA